MLDGDKMSDETKNKKILVCGWDGYIGTALTQELLKEGYSVVGIDNQQRRKAVNELGSISAIEHAPIWLKFKEFQNQGDFKEFILDIDGAKDTLDIVFKDTKFDIVINLAHIPSAPFSQKNHDQAHKTLHNNVIGTNNLLWCIKEYCPDAHYITIGSTGEYSHYGNIDIEEGYFSFEHKGRQSEEFLFPRRPGSIYHTSKVASTYLIDYLSRAWNLRCTDVMQSVVFGNYTDITQKTGINTRLDSDEEFGTVINRFVVQAMIGEPLTIYGEGLHQRGFIALNDSIQALMIAVNNPPEKGTVQSWNQLSEWHSMVNIADMVCEVAKDKYNINVEVQHVPTPRNEYTGDHYYNYVSDKLPSFGYKPTRTIKQEIDYMMGKVSDNISKNDSIIDVLKSNVIPKIKF